MLESLMIVAVTFWVVIGIVLLANGFFVYQVRMARYRVMQTLADKGQPVPPELLSGNVRRAPVGLMRGAIILLCLGGALTFFLWSMTAQSIFHGPIQDVAWLPTVGFFPIAIGIALFLMAQLERRRPQ